MAGGFPTFCENCYNVSSELMSAEQSNIALRMDVECWVVSLVGEEGGNTSRSIRGIVVSKFCKWKQISPVVLLVQAVVAEVLL